MSARRQPDRAALLPGGNGGWRHRVTRILQLVVLALVWLLVAGIAHFALELATDGMIHENLHHLVDRPGKEGLLALELASAPMLLGILTCWICIRVFRFKAVAGEVDSTLKPMIEVLRFGGAFGVFALGVAFLLMGAVSISLLHLAVAAPTLCVLFARMRAEQRRLGELLKERANSGEDDEA